MVVRRHPPSGMVPTLICSFFKPSWLRYSQWRRVSPAFRQTWNPTDCANTIGEDREKTELHILAIKNRTTKTSTDNNLETKP
jgi:hypothetical protein